MSTAAGFSVNTFNADNAKLVSRNHTTLVKGETILKLSFGLIHKAFVDVDTFINETIGLVLNSGLFFLG